MLWILFAVFLIFSVVFLCGKGAALIAGYNTADDAGKEQYSPKKLCRQTGAFTSVLALLFLVWAVLEDRLPVFGTCALIFLIIAVVLGMVIFINAFAKKNG